METLKRFLRKNSPEKFKLLTELVETSIDGTRDIFVNRPLNMSQIHYIGFDMDYTLAIYNKRAIEELAFVKTLEKLVELKNYPEQILQLEYHDDKIIRGLLIDHQKGNLIKINRFKQVCRVRHGSVEQETSVYFNDRIVQSDIQRFASVDTLFSLPEAYLYSLLVDLVEAKKISGRSFSEVFEDIRYCIDLAHKDGSLKSDILKDIKKYVYKDPHLSLTLDKFIDSGKKLFLLTNSEFYYTNMLMAYLLDTDNLTYASWRDYFDIIIVNARKPEFFKENTPFYVVNEQTQEETFMTSHHFEKEKIYSRGNCLTFEKLIQAKGNEILYIGDHIFGDIMRSDKDSNWRTVLVVQELEEELSKTAALQEKLLRLRRLSNRYDKLHYELHIFSSQLNTLDSLELSLQDLTPAESKALKKAREELKEGLQRCQREMEKIETKLQNLRGEISAYYHPLWGPLFHENDEISRFGDQVRDYASLYTSRVSNFFFYPIDRYYKSLRDIMPHDRWLELSS